MGKAETAEHTPGPWNRGGNCGLLISHALPGRTVEIATVSALDGSDTNPEAQANALLITAAPDLLEAAQNALLRAWNPAHRTDNYRLDGESMAQLRAVIATAKGK